MLYSLAQYHCLKSSMCLCWSGECCVRQIPDKEMGGNVTNVVNINWETAFLDCFSMKLKTRTVRFFSDDPAYAQINEEMSWDARQMVTADITWTSV